jgi:predicted site-specific integrase-resolvase
MFRRLSEINQIVVECPDRLARFGYAYLVEFAEAFNVAIEAVDEKESVSANEELVSDLIGIVTCFSARLYGARGGRKVGKHLEKALSEIERGELGDEDHDAVRADSVDKGAD